MQVTVYTTNYCPSCLALKKWLTDKNITYTVVNLEEEPQYQAELIEKTGSFLVPVTMVEYEDGRQEFIQGTPYGQLKQILKIA